MSRAPKVWTIETPRTAEPARPARPSSGFYAPPIGIPPATPRSRGRDAGAPTALRAYLLGPLAGLPRATAANAGLVADFAFVALAVALLASWSQFQRWLDHTPYGLLVWLAVVPTLPILVAGAWAQSIAAVRTPRPDPGSRAARWSHDPRIVAGLGLLVPGLGLLLARRGRQAAAAVWLTGPLVAAAAVLANRQWLWQRCRSGISVGFPTTALEGVFLVAAGVGGLAAVAWVVQALDGARRVSAGKGRSDRTGLALLVAVAIFAATFRPGAIAGQVHAAAMDLRTDGLALIPFVLCETAARLEPAAPAHRAEAAELADALGLAATARAHRAAIARRALEWGLAADGRPAAADRRPAVPAAAPPLATVAAPPPAAREGVPLPAILPSVPSAAVPSGSGTGARADEGDALR